MHPLMSLSKKKEAPLANLLKDEDFLEYLEENSVVAEEIQIAFAAWLKENQE